MLHSCCGDCTTINIINAILTEGFLNSIHFLVKLELPQQDIMFPYCPAIHPSIHHTWWTAFCALHPITKIKNNNVSCILQFHIQDKCLCPLNLIYERQYHVICCRLLNLIKVKTYATCNRIMLNAMLFFEFICYKINYVHLHACEAGYW
jgi:hypothetical protein